MQFLLHKKNILEAGDRIAGAQTKKATPLAESGFIVHLKIT
jgi:hypothetical protein